jgi:hypothetical protein
MLGPPLAGQPLTHSLIMNLLFNRNCIYLMIGTLFDITNSYYITFATAGSLLIISSLISFLIPNRNLEEKDEQQDIESNV